MFAQHLVLAKVEDTPALLVEFLTGIRVYSTLVAYIEAEVLRNLGILEIIEDGWCTE